MTNPHRSTGQSFFEAIVAASYITDPIVRDKVMSELADVSIRIRNPYRENGNGAPMPKLNLSEGLRRSLADQSDEDERP